MRPSPIITLATTILIGSCSSRTNTRVAPPLDVRPAPQWVESVSSTMVAFMARDGFQVAPIDTLKPGPVHDGFVLKLRYPVEKSLVTDGRFPPEIEGAGPLDSRVESFTVRDSAGTRSVKVEAPAGERLIAVTEECSDAACVFVWHGVSSRYVAAVDIDQMTVTPTRRRPDDARDGVAHSTKPITCYSYEDRGTYVNHAVCENMLTGQTLWEFTQPWSEKPSSVYVVVTTSYAILLTGTYARHGFVAIAADIRDLESGRPVQGSDVLTKALTERIGDGYQAVPYSDRILVTRLSVRGAMTESPDVSLDDLVEVDVATGKITGNYHHRVPKDQATSNPHSIPVAAGKVLLWER